MSRKVFCALILLFGVIAALAFGGAGNRLQRQLRTTDDISFVCDINTTPFEKNNDERLVRYDFEAGTAVATLVFHIREPRREMVLQRITLYSGEAKRSVYVYFAEGAEYAFVPVKGGALDALEMHETMQTIADAIELHTGEPVTETVAAAFRTGVFALTLAVTILLTVTAWIADVKTGWCDKTVSRLKEAAELLRRTSRKQILQSGGMIFGLVILSVIAAKLIPGIAFSRRALAVYLAGVLLALYGIWCLRKEIIKSTERVFLITALLLGGVFILIAPPLHGGWDTDMHYKYALQASGFGAGQRSLSELLLIENMPDAAVDEVPVVNRLHTEVLEELDTVYAGEVKGPAYVTHLPAGLGLALGRLLGLGFTARFRLGELMNLLLYVLLIYLAIRRLHSGKILLALVALLPTDLFLATTYGYDYWVLGFLFLGVAVFIGMRQEGDAPVKAADVCVMAFSLSLACILKQNYLPIALLPFFMPPEKIRSKVRYYLLCIMPVVLLGVSLLLRSGDVAKSGGDLRGGSVDAAAQLGGILAQPFTYAGLLLKELVEKLSPFYYCKGVTNYGEFGYADVAPLTCVFLVLLVIAAFADRNEKDAGVKGWKLKTFMVLNFLGGVALILTAFYLVYTPVGAQEIKGVQARYFTPLVYPLLAVIGTRGISSFKEKETLRTGYLSGIYLAEVLLIAGTALQILVRT